MGTLLPTIDQFLRREGLFGETPTVPVTARELFRRQLQMVLLCGAVYGGIMGSYNGFLGDGWKQVLLSATKVPILFFVTFLLCLPSFYVINALAGLRGDFPRVLNALLAFQSLASVVLAALGPITGLMNVSTANYGFIVLWSGIVFAVASLSGQWRMRQQYRVLILANIRHRWMLVAWTALYWFVAIQMAWVLRPFVGDPRRPFQIFRPEAWSNAYVHILQLIDRVLFR